MTLSGDPSPSSPNPTDTHSGNGTNPLLSWVQLVRLPNVFTVLADVGAAYLLVGGGPAPSGRFALILAAGVAFYWSGMILNDVFDVEKDRAERNRRPIPSGAISRGAAARAGWGFLILGVVLAAAAGYVPGSEAQDVEAQQTWLPAAIAIALAAMIVAYDGPLKPTPLAPAAMGGCRVLSFLLGASPLIPLVNGIPTVPQYLIGIAFGFGVYVMGITTFARDEATGGHRVNLRTGFVVMMIGAAMLALAPGMAAPQERAGWAVQSPGQFAMLILLIAMPIAMRGFRAQLQPEPAIIGNTIRASILTIIPLAASFAFLGAGPKWGLAIFALVIPAIVLASKLRVT